MGRIKADAVLLDVDGTLWDSTALVADAWARAVAEEGCAREVRSGELRGLFGKPMDQIAHALLPELDGAALGRVMQRCVRYEEAILRRNQCDISYPGVSATVRELSARLPVCIVSNCQEGYIELVMGKLGIADCIADYESYGHTGRYKEENIRAVVARNSYHAPVYVGDIQGDCDAAHGAGVRFIHAAYGFGTADAPEAVVSAFTELLDMVEPAA